LRRRETASGESPASQAEIKGSRQHGDPTQCTGAKVGGGLEKPINVARLPLPAERN